MPDVRRGLQAGALATGRSTSARGLITKVYDAKDDMERH